MFHNFLAMVRKGRNVSLEKLAEGLCDASWLARIEKGERSAEKPQRDRLLGRLGVSFDRYENLLDATEFKVWELQKNILDSVEKEDAAQAEKLLAEYESALAAEDAVSRQFCLTMRAQLMEQQDIPEKEIGKVYEEAVKLTIPCPDEKHIRRMCLSVEELNLILAYRWFCRDGNFKQDCNAVFEYLEHSYLDDLAKVKVYPRAAYYYNKKTLEEGKTAEEETLLDCLRICNQAIELLRNTGRAYYLWELLDQWERIFQGISDIWRANGQKERIQALVPVQQKMCAWKELLEGLYEEYGVPKQMRSCAYLYRQTHVFCVGDVLRIRRKMLGWTQEELCRGICSVKTLRRAERKQTNMQAALLRPLLERLGLSGELQQAEVITERWECLKWQDEYVTYSNNRELEKAAEALEKMKSALPLEIPVNRQYTMFAETTIALFAGTISREEHTARLKRALECTLPYEAVFYPGAKYMTITEITCVRNMARYMDEESGLAHLKALRQIYRVYEQSDSIAYCIDMYEFVMLDIASGLGNRDRFDEADAIDRRVIREGLCCRRLIGLDYGLYDLLWNYRERKKKKLPVGEAVDEIEGLKKCVLLCQLEKKSYMEKMYRKMLEEWGYQQG